ncbi:AAA family ATPase [Sphingomonas cannabina]|uniref:AAA family ATPase n=1 Tax=Sphingomonas cannabina TaxID=2899123 RepID=UPI001F287051|nr:AAA family ATPase [Sphingomonas cannabina]UIJ43781.1 AAA family ATPase [Sphingomonas cannabina]
MAVDFDAVRRDYPLQEVVGKTLNLRRSGGNMVAVCPFHPDKNPSLVLFKDQTYHCFGCGAHGDVIDFVAGTQHLSISESIRFLTGGEAPRLDDADRERRRRAAAERESRLRRQQEAATIEARRRWERALPVNGIGNAYLDRKGVAPYGCRREGENLLVPIYDDVGEILSVQSIPPEPGGRKLFHGGAPVAGGTLTLGDNPEGPVIIVEGFATGATVQAATGFVVIVGFSKGALKRTAEIARARHPTRAIIVAADTNGIDAAEEAAAAVGGRVVVPDLQGAEGTDFNDQAAHYGLEDVGRSFAPPLVAPETPLPLVWFDDNQPYLSGNWLIKNVVPAEAFVTIIGHPGCGKSFLALDIALHIASGRQWQDRKVKQGLVLYLAAEGQRGQQNRVEAWRRHNEVDGLPFALIPVAINLRDAKADLPKLIATIEAAVAMAGLPLAALVVDTLNRTFGGGDENGVDMSAYVDNVGKIQSHFDCTALVVHHIPKNAETISERGHGSLRGAIETSLLVQADAESGVRTLICKKQKDAEDGWKLQFRLKVVELGEDEDGDPVTSCVVVPATDEIAAQRSRGPSLSPTQRQVYNELLAALEAAPVSVPRDIPEDQIDRMKVGKVVSKSTWRDRWLAIGGSDMESETAARTFRRAITELQNKGLVGVWNDHAWATFQ